MFNNGDKVKVTSGVHEGLRGEIVTTSGGVEDCVIKTSDLVFAACTFDEIEADND